jgi:hypothetical protein
LVIVELSETRSIGFVETSSADCEPLHYCRHSVEMWLLQVQVVPGDRLQGAGEIIDIDGRYPAAACN